MIRLVLAGLLLALAAAAAAQDRIPSHLHALAGEIDGAACVQLASYRDPRADDAACIAHIDHASFLIQPGNVAAVTDFTGAPGGADLVPGLVTMNNAHVTRFTQAPDPAIGHVLQGWALGAEPEAQIPTLG